MRRHAAAIMTLFKIPSMFFKLSLKQAGTFLDHFYGASFQLTLFEGEKTRGSRR